MKILAVSDEVVDWIYSAALRDRCADVDLVLGCGDLPIYYLEFVASSLDVPCAYVRGNHDTYEVGAGGAIKSAPAGWMNLDMRRSEFGRLRVAGLEGCLRYKPDAPYQYTQNHQRLRAYWLASQLAIPQLIGATLDVMLSHAPPYGIHDGPDHPHTGFRAFNWMMEVFKPRFWLHGHRHRSYAPREAVETVVGNTRVLNVHPYRIFEA